MMNNPKPISEFLVPGKRAHLVGIGGVSMCPLAEVLAGKGLLVQGSDMMESDSVKHLRSKGISVAIGHNAENLGDCDFVIRTAAVHDGNPEIAGAIARGIPVYERAQAWGALMRKYPNALCVSGTHGKTTTTSMVTHILLAAQWDPTVMIGGYLPILHAGHRVGKGNSIVLESCEYCDSFLNFFPTTAVVLNIEADHLDYFHDLADIQKSFRKFSQLVPRETGRILANGDDGNTMEALKGLALTTFGISEHNQIHGRGYSHDWRDFEVICDGRFYCNVQLNVFGRHNAANALAAAAVAWSLGIPGDAVTRGLESFRGAGRRLEFKGNYRGADVYDDYAHHPGELHATIAAVRAMGYHRIVLAFQPHTYSRTAALFDDFVRELRTVDQVVLAEIYAARERNTVGISSRDLANQVPGAVYFETLPEVTTYLRRIARPDDVILTVGAGDIYQAGEALLKQR